MFQELKKTRVWRHQKLTARESEEPQKLTSSESLKITRSWSLTESEDKSLELVKSVYSEVISLQKEWKLGATAISEEFKGIRCLSTKERKKRTIVHLYNHNHYPTTPLFMSAIVQEYSCTYTSCSPNKEWIWNWSSLGQLINQATW